MHKKLQEYFLSLDDHIEESRKPILDQIATYIQENDYPKLNFICTHNSRRSHLSQIWAQVCAHHFGVDISTFSGGTEATEFNPNAVAALSRAGFEILSEEGNNPRYTISFSEDYEPLICYSKTYDDPVNPQSNFAAILTCSEADAGCPLVHGSNTRIKLFYNDPKVADGTPEEAQTYDMRCEQIAQEMRYLFSSIK